VRMMSHTPARIMGVDGQKGSIAAGKDADLVAFDDEIEVSLVMVRGLLAWRSAGV
jgi:N-acetylglucosamine-6-phosphate deacetylase